MDAYGRAIQTDHRGLRRRHRALQSSVLAKALKGWVVVVEAVGARTEYLRDSPPRCGSHAVLRSRDHQQQQVWFACAMETQRKGGCSMSGATKGGLGMWTPGNVAQGDGGSRRAASQLGGNKAVSRSGACSSKGSGWACM